MLRRDLEIVNKLGLHARAAAKLVNCATRFGSLIEVERRGQRVNCKSARNTWQMISWKNWPHCPSARRQHRACLLPPGLNCRPRAWSNSS